VPVPKDFVVEPGAPFERITRPLAGHAASYMLHQALTSAFESPVLARRTKLLLFAVVARMLECRFCAPEAARLLQDEGFEAAEVEACLASLASPRLDPTETAILEWARETVRYQPTTIQKRTRALRERIGAQAALEAVGLAALANATVRIAMLVD
jgi:hypothetical protein